MAALGLAAGQLPKDVLPRATSAAAIRRVSFGEAAETRLDCPVTRPAARRPVCGAAAPGRPYQRRVPLGMYFRIRPL